MKFTSVVAALGALNVAMAAPAGLPGLGDVAGLIPGLPAGLPTPPSGSSLPFPVPSGVVPSSIPTPSGLPFELPGLSEGSGIVRRSFVPRPAKGALPFPEHHHRPLPTGALRAVPQPSGGFPAPTGGFFTKDDVPVTNLA